MKDKQNTDALPPELRDILSRHFERIVIFSGAGMSADSGLPTFRSGDDSQWKGLDPDDFATVDGWRRDKETVWGWYEWGRGIVMAAQPHPGHVAVAELQHRRDAAIITQNVDDLHERAGATKVLHLHGSLFAARCFACGKPYALGEPQQERRRLAPPKCPHCGEDIRPGVVWFGESLDAAIVEQAWRLIAGCDLLLIVGTSGVVHPAAGMVDEAPPEAAIVEINPHPDEGSSMTGKLMRGMQELFGTEQNRIDFQWRTTAAKGLPAMARVL
jgi:NAD-dependent deacetylase